MKSMNAEELRGHVSTDRICVHCFKLENISTTFKEKERKKKKTKTKKLW